MNSIHIANDFSDAPGGRFIKDGEHSGEEFYRDLLHPHFCYHLVYDSKLEICIDDLYGMSVGWIDETFGQLSREYGSKKCQQIINIVHDGCDELYDTIWEAMEEY